MELIQTISRKLKQAWAKVKGWVYAGLVTIGVLAGSAMAADRNFSWTNPTQNTDGTAFDPATEQHEARLYCDIDAAAFVPESPGVPQTLTPTAVAPGAATALVANLQVGNHTCYATVVSVYGYESALSGGATFVVTPTVPPQAPQGLTVSE